MGGKNPVELAYYHSIKKERTIERDRKIRTLKAWKIEKRDSNKKKYRKGKNKNERKRERK